MALLKGQYKIKIDGQEYSIYSLGVQGIYNSEPIWVKQAKVGINCGWRAPYTCIIPMTTNIQFPSNYSRPTSSEGANYNVNADNFGNSVLVTKTSGPGPDETAAYGTCAVSSMGQELDISTNTILTYQDHYKLIFTGVPFDTGAYTLDITGSTIPLYSDELCFEGEINTEDDLFIVPQSRETIQNISLPWNSITLHLYMPVVLKNHILTNNHPTRSYFIARSESGYERQLGPGESIPWESDVCYVYRRSTVYKEHLLLTNS